MVILHLDLLLRCSEKAPTIIALNGGFFMVESVKNHQLNKSKRIAMDSKKTPANPFSGYTFTSHQTVSARFWKARGKEHANTWCKSTFRGNILVVDKVGLHVHDPGLRGMYPALGCRMQNG